MEHFFDKDINSLCCSLDQLEDHLAMLTPADVAHIRKLPSFVAYEEKCKKSEKEMLTHGSSKAIKVHMHLLQQLKLVFYMGS